MTEAERAEIERERAAAGDVAYEPLKVLPISAAPALAVAPVVATLSVIPATNGMHGPKESATSTVFKSKFTLLEILHLNAIVEKALPRKERERWQESLALAIMVGGTGGGGVFYAERDEAVGIVALFWRTDNINVDVTHRLPEYDKEGSTVYVCWLWNLLGLRGVMALRRHIENACPGARFIGHHDYRARGQKPARSKRERLRGSSVPIITNLRVQGFVRQNGTTRGV